MHNFKSHFWWDFLAYCNRLARVNLVMAFTGCLFDSFSIFLLSLKQQQNLMKIIFSCIHFPAWPYPPQIMKKTVLYTGKLYGLTAMKVLSCFFLLIWVFVIPNQMMLLKMLFMKHRHFPFFVSFFILFVFYFSFLYFFIGFLHGNNMND